MFLERKRQPSFHLLAHQFESHLKNRCQCNICPEIHCLDCTVWTISTPKPCRLNPVAAKSVVIIFKSTGGAGAGRNLDIILLNGGGIFKRAASSCRPSCQILELMRSLGDSPAHTLISLYYALNPGLASSTLPNPH